LEILLMAKLKRSQIVREDGVVSLVDTGSAEALTRHKQELQTLREDALTESKRLLEQVEAAETFEASELLRENAAAATRRVTWIEGRLPQIESRLARAKERERAEKAIHHLAVRRTVFVKLRAAIEAAASAQAEAIAADNAACAALGESYARATVPQITYRGVLLSDAVATWVDYCENALGTKPVIPQTPVVMTTRPKAVPQAAGSQKNVRLGVDDVFRKTYAASLPDDDSQLESGQVRARVLRAGYPDHKGQQSHRGRIIRVAALDAAISLANGAIEVLDAGDSDLPLGFKRGIVAAENTFKALESAQ
jgi:hypothetical protein